jgi:two-component system OmpR family sensor kinase
MRHWREMRRLWPGLLAAAALAIFGLGIGGLMERDILPNQLLTGKFAVDLAGLSVRAGIVLGGLALGITAAVWGVNRAIERIQVQEQRLQAESRQRFIQRLDHELKNPLTIIRLGIVNLQQGAGLSDSQADTIARIDQQVQRLQKLVVDLRLLTELDQRSIEHKAVDLKELLEEAISLVSEATSPERPITLTVQQTPWPLTAVWGDRDLLMLAFRNLLDNALKFSEPGDRVEIRASEDGRMAIVEIADTGAGIPAEELSQIFEELYRGQNARGIPGSGLGLKLVERILLLHHGDIQVRSKPEQGSVFTVKIPLVE